MLRSDPSGSICGLLLLWKILEGLERFPEAVGWPKNLVFQEHYYFILQEIYFFKILLGLEVALIAQNPPFLHYSWMNVDR